MPDTIIINTADAVTYSTERSYFVGRGQIANFQSSGLVSSEVVDIYNDEGEQDYEQGDPIQFTATNKNISVRGPKRVFFVKAATAGVVKVKKVAL